MNLDSNLQLFIPKIEKIIEYIQILFSSTHLISDFIITNFKEDGQDSYYCLIIQQKIIKLAWKNQQTESMMILDMEQKEFLVDDKEQELTLFNDFQLKIAQILRDLKSNQANVYKGKV